MMNGLRHYGFMGGVVGLLAGTTVASTPTFTLTLAGYRRPGQDEVIFRNLPSTQVGVECDPNDDVCPHIAGPGSECVATEVLVSGFFQYRCSPIRGIVPLLCEGGPTPGEPCVDDADCAPGTCTGNFVEPGDQIAIDVFLRGWDDDLDMGICTDRVTVCGMDGSPPCRGRHCNLDLQACSDLHPCPAPQVCVADECLAGPLLGGYSWTADRDSFASQTAGDDNASMYPAPLPCNGDDDCRHGRVNTVQCTCGDSTCRFNSTCTPDGAAYIDLIRADFLYKDEPSHFANVDLYSLTFFGLSYPGLDDDQKEEYTGTLWLQVPNSGGGTYNLDLFDDQYFTTVLDELGVEYPSVNIEGLQVEIYNPCAGFDIATECGDPTNACRVLTCFVLSGEPICVEVPRDCAEEEGEGYCCIVDEGGCVPCRACCAGPCRVKSHLECDDIGGSWMVDDLTCVPDPCVVPSCGDGVVNAGEECDDAGESATCDTDCTVAECGDGTLNVTAGEECDDGNTESGDGCDEGCRSEFGACCVGTACSVTVLADCLASGGSFFGISSTCDAPDADGDGLRNECDGCPDDPNKIEPGICGCGRDDNADSDGDGVRDCDDQCPGVDDASFAPDCIDAIPTVSAWGLIVMTLLLLTGIKMVFAGREPTQASCSEP
ncbi:MAG: hypothetical protein ACYTFA_02885 [Planctomycetota bacterium]|jgi:cysteine-rich repeat protein